MKLSKIMKPLSMILFYMPFTWMLFCLFSQYRNLYITLGTAFATFLLTFFIRKNDTKAVRIILMVLVILGLSFVEYGFFVMPIPVYVIWMIFCIANLVDISKETEFLLQSNGFYSVLFVILYTVDFAYEKADMYIAFALFAVFIIAKHLQNVAVRNEKQLDIISNYSVIDREQMQRTSSITSLRTGLVLLLICVVIGFFGKLSTFDGINNGVRNVVKTVVNYVHDFDADKEEEEAILDDDDNPFPEVEMGIDESPVHPIWRVLGIVGTIVVFFYFIFLVVDKIITIRKNRVYMPDLGTEVKIVREEEKEEKIEKPVKAEDYSHRKAIRRIYKNIIKKGRGKRNDDLMSKTPAEQRDKKLKEGYDVSDEFVAMYERARYSKDVITKQDVKDMHNLK